MSGSDVTIEPATAADIPVITDLWLGFVNHHTRLDDQLELDQQAVDYYRDYFATLLNQETTGAFVARAADRVIGYVLGGMKQCPAPLKQHRYGLIAELYVNEGFRKLNIGRDLINRLEQWFMEKKARYIEIDVFSENDEGVAFWRKHGYHTKRYIMRKDSKPV